MTDCCGAGGCRAAPDLAATGRSWGPWLRIGLVTLLASWSMLLGLAVNTTAADSRTVFRIHSALALMAATACLLLGRPLARNTWRAVRRFRLTIELLFVTALLSALAFSAINMWRGSGAVYFETVIVVLLIYSFGNQVNDGARKRATDALRSFGRPEGSVRRVLDDGSFELVPPDRVRPGDLFDVGPGSAVLLDAEIVEGEALVEASAISGEWRPVARRPGDRVLAGSHPLDGRLRLRAARRREESVVVLSLATIDADLVARARSVKQANRMLRWFVPMVWGASLASFAAWSLSGDPGQGTLNALAVLLVACPCALGFATPTLVWATSNRLAQLGIRISDPDLVERLAGVDTVVLDKTGTVTLEKPRLERVTVVDGHRLARGEIFALIATVERNSKHPVAKALADLSDGPSAGNVDRLEVVSGVGVRATVTLEGRRHSISIGRADALEGSDRSAAHRLGETPVEDSIAVVVDGALAAVISLAERIHDSWAEAARELRARGVRTVVVSGDSEARVRRVAADEHRSRRTPTEKRDDVRALQKSGRTVLFVGDGVNDAPAMAAADASLAVADGADVAVAAADGVLDPAALGALPDALAIARRARRLLRSNLVYAATYNLVGMTAAAFGYLHPILAAAIMVTSSLTVTFRSLGIVEPSRSPRPAE